MYLTLYLLKRNFFKEIRKKCFEECENSTGSSEDKQICRSKFEPLTRTTTTRSTTTTTTTTTTEEEGVVFNLKLVERKSDFYQN